MLLKISDLTVAIEKKIILHKINLKINEGEIHVIFGPNGSGKSTLLKSIMSIPPYEIVSGKILLDNEDITYLKSYEKARKGIAIAYQTPPPIEIKTKYLLKKLQEKYKNDYKPEIIPKNLYERNIFVGFSGGESKKTELGLILLQKPRVALLDEPDSGVDVDGIKDVAKVINKLRDMGSAIMLVTHQGFITKYIDNIDKAYVLINGKIVFSGDFLTVYRKIITEGYREWS
ncbi:MAG: ABC transporter ATP-binding protein [Thermoproteales archaeon]|nr:ABC transporter ATP-binding protein [Thermoproteales archaeon]